MMRPIVSIIACAVLFVAAGNCVRGQSATPDQRSGSPVVATTSTASNTLADADHLYRTGQLDNARDAYNRIIQSDPKSAPAYVGLVRVYLKQKNPPDAYTAAQKAIEIEPSLDAAREAQAEVLFRQGKIPEAEREFVALVN